MSNAYCLYLQARSYTTQEVLDALFGHITVLCLSSTLAANEQQTSGDEGPDQESDQHLLATVQNIPTYAFALTDEDQAYQAAAVEEEQEGDNSADDDANYFAFV